MNMLGLNPNEQEVIDIPNHVARQNTIYKNFKMVYVLRVSLCHCDYMYPAQPVYMIRDTLSSYLFYSNAF